MIKIKKAKQIELKWLTLLATMLVMVCLFLSGCGEKTQKMYRVGILSGADSFADAVGGFMSKMDELGYIEGKNVVYDIHKTNADPIKEEEILKTFVSDKVDLIFVFPTGPTIKAKEIITGTGIPIVFAIVTLEGTDLVDSVSKPGDHITGVQFPGVDMTVKRFEMLLEMAPWVRSVWVAYHPDYPPAKATVKVLRQAALTNGVILIELHINSVEDIKADLEKRAASADIGIDAIQLIPDIISKSPESWGAISKFAAEHNIPIVGTSTAEVYKGAVFTYIPDNHETGELAASLANEILHGKPAGDIMVLTPDIRLKLNYKLAQELGLNISEGMLSRADEVIR